MPDNRNSMMMTLLNSILSSDQIGFFDIFYQDNLGTGTWNSAGSLDYRLGKG